MSGDASTAGRSATRAIRRLLAGTAVAIRGALGRRDGRVVFALASLGYLALYLWGIGYLGQHAGGTTVIVVDDPFQRATEQIAPYTYEPVALVAAGPVEFLFSPLNTILGAGLGLLVGLNFAVSWVAWRGPTACRLGPGAGAAAGVPALLSGFACCGPTILLVVGLQASAGIVAAFRWLVPASVLLLVLTLLWVGTKVQQ